MTELLCEAAPVGAPTLINHRVGTGDQWTSVPTRPHFCPRTPARNKGRCGSHALDGELQSRRVEAGLGHADLIRGLCFGFPPRPERLAEQLQEPALSQLETSSGQPLRASSPEPPAFPPNT